MKKALAILGLLSLSAASAQKVQQEFWTIALSPFFDDEMKRLVAEYEKQNPNVELKWVDVPYDAIEQKLLAAVAAGRPPTVVNLNSDITVKLQTQGALQDFSGLDKKVLDSYFKNALDTFTFDNKVYGLPWYWAPKVVMYNTEIFKKAGISAPPKTVQGMIDAARTIKDKTGNYGFVPNINGQNILYLFQEAGLPILSKDGKRAVFNSPEHVRLLQTYVDLQKKNYVPDETMRRGFTLATELYSAGKLGMLVTGPQFLLRVEKENPKVYAQTQVAAYPIDLGGNVIHTPLMSFAIPKGVKDKAAAMKLAAFLTNDANQLAFSKATKTTFPSTKAASKDAYFRRVSDAPVDQARLISSKELAKARDLTVSVPNASRLFKAVKDNTEAAMLGTKSVKAALDETVKVWNDSLK